TASSGACRRRLIHTTAPPRRQGADRVYGAQGFALDRRWGQAVDVLNNLLATAVRFHGCPARSATGLHSRTTVAPARLHGCARGAPGGFVAVGHVKAPASRWGCRRGRRPLHWRCARPGTRPGYHAPEGRSGADSA